jgi:Protein of unknown function (DUF3592)
MMSFLKLCVGLLVGLAAGCFGMASAMMLPGSLGAVRDLAALVGFAAGVGIVGWLVLFLFGLTALLGSVRQVCVTLCAVAVPALLYWGPIVGGNSLAHGISDQRLVSLLRQHGAAVPGSIVDMPTTGTAAGDDGTPSTYSTDHYFLRFTAGAYGTFLAPDPAIAGQIWPVNDMGTAKVTVVYDRANPNMAAVAGQIRNSPWAGAPEANVISGAVLTVIFGVVLWVLIREARAAVRRSRLQKQWPGARLRRVPAQ